MEIYVSSTMLIWGAFLILSLGLTVCILTFILYRREKVLQLMKFSLSPINVSLTLELNKDKKLELLALENRVLRQQIRGLKSKKLSLKLSALANSCLFLIYILATSLKTKDLIPKSKTEDKEDNATNPS